MSSEPADVLKQDTWVGVQTEQRDLDFRHGNTRRKDGHEAIKFENNTGQRADPVWLAFALFSRNHGSSTKPRRRSWNPSLSSKRTGLRSNLRHGYNGMTKTNHVFPIKRNHPCHPAAANDNTTMRITPAAMANASDALLRTSITSLPLSSDEKASEVIARISLLGPVDGAPTVES